MLVLVPLALTVSLLLATNSPELYLSSSAPSLAPAASRAALLLMSDI